MSDFSSADLLLDVAKMIEVNPQRHKQNLWVLDGVVEPSFRDVVRDGVRGQRVKVSEAACGTKACVCGWAVLLAPQEKLVEILDSDLPSDAWMGGGRALLEMDMSLADAMFAGSNPTTGLADALRDIALLPPVRTFEAALEAGILKRYPASLLSYDWCSKPHDLNLVHPKSLWNMEDHFVHPDSKLPPGWGVRRLRNAGVVLVRDPA